MTVDDLMGFDDDEEVQPARPRASLYEQDDIAATGQLNEILTGVSVTFLMQAFRMDRMTVRKKLADLSPIRYGRGNSPVYDFVQACGYLVKPKVDMAEYIKSIKSDDLPLNLQKEYWDAKLKYQRWAERAGDLWRTEDVLTVLGDTFKTIKTTVQLWTESIERAHGLTDEQRVTLSKMGDMLLDEIHLALVEQSKNKATSSQLQEHTDE